MTENVDPIARVCSILDRALQRDGVRVRFSTRNGDAESKFTHACICSYIHINCLILDTCIRMLGVYTHTVFVLLNEQLI